MSISARSRRWFVEGTSRRGVLGHRCRVSRSSSWPVSAWRRPYDGRNVELWVRLDHDRRTRSMSGCWRRLPLSSWGAPRLRCRAAPPVGRCRSRCIGVDAGSGWTSSRCSFARGWPELLFLADSSSAEHVAAASGRTDEFEVEFDSACAFTWRGRGESVPIGTAREVVDGDKGGRGRSQYEGMRAMAYPMGLATWSARSEPGAIIATARRAWRSGEPGCASTVVGSLLQR
jgi:hypothetical protein